MIVTSDRLVIIRGEDKSPIFKIKDRGTKDPINLTDITNITIELIKANRVKAIYDMTVLPAKKAKLEIEDVSFSADQSGGIGNSIILSANGVDDVDTIVNTWNAGNPSNTVSYLGDGDTVLDEGNYRLEGGLQSYQPVQIVGEPLLGKIKLVLTELDTVLLRRGDSQLVKITLDWGYPPSGLRRIAKFRNMDVLEAV